MADKTKYIIIGKNVPNEETKKDEEIQEIIDGVDVTINKVVITWNDCEETFTLMSA